MAAVPKIIKNFHLQVDGVGYAGICDEVRLPDIKIRGEEHRAGGMDAPIMIDLGMDRLEMGFTLAEHKAEVFRQFGLMNQNAVQLTFRAAKVDDLAVEPYLINARGMYTENRLGTIKNNSISKLEATVSLRYFKLSLAGNVIWEIDVDNMVRAINGVDQLEAVRAAIGL